MLKLNIHHYVEIAAFLISMLCIKKLRHSPLIWFVPYLFFIVFVEISGKYYASVLHKRNGWIYNISVPLEYLFYSFIFYIHLAQPWFKKIVITGSTLFALYAVYFWVAKDIQSFNASFLSIGSGLMVLYCCLFFWQLFEGSEEVQLLKTPMFWISAGLFLFNLGEFTYNLFSGFLFEKGDRAAKFFQQINNYLNLVLYFCISIGLLWKKASAGKSA